MVKNGNILVRNILTMEILNGRRGGLSVPFFKFYYEVNEQKVSQILMIWNK